MADELAIHFARMSKGGVYPGLDVSVEQRAEMNDMVKARYYLGGQKYGAVFAPSPSGPATDLQPISTQVGVEIGYRYLGPGSTERAGSIADIPAMTPPMWHRVAPTLITRYAFVCTGQGREPELATRNGRLVVSTDRDALGRVGEPVVYVGDPAWTVPVEGER